MQWFCKNCDAETKWVEDPNYQIRTGSYRPIPNSPPRGYTCGNCLKRQKAETARIEKQRLAEERRAAASRATKPSTANIVKQLESLNELYRQGALTREQFESAKNQLLGMRNPPLRPPSSSGNWYTDPTERFEKRWWDGTKWTEHVWRENTKHTDPPLSPLSSPSDPANWYTDPTERFEKRWWDGTKWTEHVWRENTKHTDPPTA